MRRNEEIFKVMKAANRLIVSVIPEEIAQLERYCDRRYCEMKHTEGVRWVIKLTRLINAWVLYREKLIEIENEPVKDEGQKLEERRIYNRKKKKAEGK